MQASSSSKKPHRAFKIRARLDPNLCRIDPRVQDSPAVCPPRRGSAVRAAIQSLDPHSGPLSLDNSSKNNSNDIGLALALDNALNKVIKSEPMGQREKSFEIDLLSPTNSKSATEVTTKSNAFGNFQFENDIGGDNNNLNNLSFDKNLQNFTKEHDLPQPQRSNSSPAKRSMSGRMSRSLATGQNQNCEIRPSKPIGSVSFRIPNIKDAQHWVYLKNRGEAIFFQNNFKQQKN